MTQPTMDIEEVDVAYGMDPLDLLIHLEELHNMITASMQQDKPVHFKRAPRPSLSTLSSK